MRPNAETVKSIVDRVTLGLTGRTGAHNPVVAGTDDEIHKLNQKTAIQARAADVHVNLCVTDWVATQWEDTIEYNID